MVQTLHHWIQWGVGYQLLFCRDLYVKVRVLTRTSQWKVYRSRLPSGIRNWHPIVHQCVCVCLCVCVSKLINHTPSYTSIWWFPEIGVPPVIIHFSGMFPHKNHLCWVSPISGNHHLPTCTRNGVLKTRAAEFCRSFSGTGLGLCQVKMSRRSPDFWGRIHRFLGDPMQQNNFHLDHLGMA